MIAHAADPATASHLWWERPAAACGELTASMCWLALLTFSHRSPNSVLRSVRTTSPGLARNRYGSGGRPAGQPGVNCPASSDKTSRLPAASRRPRLTRRGTATCCWPTVGPPPGEATAGMHGRQRDRITCPSSRGHCHGHGGAESAPGRRLGRPALEGVAAGRRRAQGQGVGLCLVPGE
jgi:hypothetical protein